MPLTLTQTPGGILHYTFAGAIGVSGAPASQSLNLTAFPLYVRRDPNFASQLNVVIKSLVSGVSNATNLVVVNDADGVPVSATFDVTSNNVNNNVNIFVWLTASTVR